MMHVSNKELDSSTPLKSYVSLYFGYVTEFRSGLVHLTYTFWTSVGHHIVPILRTAL